MILFTSRPLRSLSGRYGFNMIHRRGRHALNLPSQPTVSSDDGTRTFRLRKDGSQMPLPPVMDAKVNEARMKWEQPKPAPNKEDMTPFQKQLEANPYARALATPIRQCHLTRAHVPGHFLIPFTTNTPKRPEEGSKEPQGKSKLVPAIHFKPDTECTYTLATDEVIGELVGKKKRWEMLINDRMQRRAASRTGRKGSKVKNDWELGRPDLKEEIREKLELVAVRFLIRAMKSEESPLVVPLPADDLKSEQVASVLHFGVEVEGEIDFPETEHYYLEELLAEENVDHLRSEFNLGADTRAVALLKHERTAWALMAVHKLQNFLRPAH